MRREVEIREGRGCVCQWMKGMRVEGTARSLLRSDVPCSFFPLYCSNSILPIQLLSFLSLLLGELIGWVVPSPDGPLFLTSLLRLLRSFLVVNFLVVGLPFSRA